MASKVRSRAPRQRKPNQLAELGLFDIPDLDAIDDGDDDSDVDESTLESELEALLTGKAPAKPTRPKKAVVAPVDIEKMAADCLKDLDEDEDDGSDVAMDEDLLKELHSLTVDEVSPNQNVQIVKETKSDDSHEPDSSQNAENKILTVLGERLNLYNDALRVAKTVGDSSKVRRYGRAIKTLEGLLKSAKSGATINEEDIPPVVSIPKKSNVPVPTVQQPAISVPDTLKHESTSENVCDDAQVPPEQAKSSGLLKSEEFSVAKALTMRRDQYKMAALTAKRAGDKAAALNYMKILKTFDPVIEAVKNGETVDLSNVPAPPPGYPEYPIQGGIPKERRKTNEEMQTFSEVQKAALAAANEPEDPEIFAAPPPPTSILEALQQRHDKYLNAKAAAETEGNSGKVRRLQRIIKTYETAIKDYKAGKTVDFDSLPTPPGFAPIPLGNQPSEAEAVSSNKGPGLPAAKPKAPLPSSKTTPEAARTDVPPKKPKIQRTNTTSLIDKQLEFLLTRQKMFRQAALDAKRNGDMQQAKEYLRMSKGFDSMIEATKCGLPIDASSIPTPPQLETDFVIVDVSECNPGDENQFELLETLEKDLTHQIEVCSRNKEHFLRLGDVSSASKFERLGLESRKDMTVIQNLKKKGLPPPKFHYETRLFSMIQCHPDLSDNELEVTIERGINLPGKPDELDSYVKLEFPIPSEAPQHAKTHTVRDTNNPIFQEEFKLEINRKSRAQLRQFKRHTLKLEVWSKGGFFRSGSLLGTANIRLSDLESKCTIHDCFSLMDGRKASGGKLEVKIRIRDPLLSKQVEEVREKWLVIGS